MMELGLGYGCWNASRWLDTQSMESDSDRDQTILESTASANVLKRSASELQVQPLLVTNMSKPE